MAHYKGLIDQWGRPIEKNTLTRDIAAPTITGVRTPLTSYPGDGLDPARLGAILKEADAGDPLRYLELAETMEERFPHYAGVLSTRKRSVCQLEVTVEAASDSPLHQEQADMVRDWFKRDELTDELFDILDAIGRGYSFTEIIWNSSEGQWEPARLEWRDPRWFRFERVDGKTPLMLEENGSEIPLPGFKFIRNVIRAKSGLPVRSGIARIVTWLWLFSAYTQRDWAIFTQNYGQPVRIGKYGPGATEEDRNTLFRAVANIAGDCAAIIPESMTIEFVESSTGSTSLSLYKDRADWLDQQTSKTVLGQTATTDAIAGGHAVGQEHRLVQEDIERADARVLSSVVNRDLIRPWMMLEYGQAADCPRVKIGRAEQTDVAQAVTAVRDLVPLGLKIGQNQMRDIIGVGAPDDGDELLSDPLAGIQMAEDARPLPPTEPIGEARQRASQAGRSPNSRERKQSNALQALMDGNEPRDPGEAIAQAGAAAARPGIDELVRRIKRIIDSAASLEEAAALVREAIDSGSIAAAPVELEDAMRQALLLAELTGRAEVEQADG